MFSRSLFLIILSFSLFSCKKEKSDSILNENDNQEFVFPNADFKVDFNIVSQYYSARKKDEIELFYNENINVKDFSGAVLVAKNGKIIFEDYQGMYNYEKNEPINQNSPLHIASISKVFTASVILRLSESKKLSLDQSLQSILPEFPHQNITLRMLLNHRSGLPQYAYFTDKDSVWNKKETLRNKDIIPLLVKHKIPLEAKPDTKFSYCNTNYALLALVIEKITNMSYPIAMKKLLFEPLGMKNTFVLDFDSQKELASMSYKSTKVRIGADHLDAIYGDKNIYSTPRDLLLFDMATYSDKFYSKKLREEIFKGYSYERKGIKNYGLGIRLREWETGQTLHYHNGWWHGSTSSYVTLRKDTVTLVALSNKFTRRTYQLKRFSALFGDYPFKLTNEETAED